MLSLWFFFFTSDFTPFSGSAVCALYPCLHLNQNISTAVDGVNDMATAFNHSRQNVAQLSTLSSYGESQAVQLVDQLRVRHRLLLFRGTCTLPGVTA